MTTRILQGDCRSILRTMPDASVHCCVTSPPYFGLRDYGVAGQIGLEESPDAFVAEMVEVFSQVRRVLRPDGSLWLNLGDSYAGSWGAQSREHAGKHAPNVSALSANQVKAAARRQSGTGSIPKDSGLKPKDLMGIPWRVAFALRADGWWLRQALPWLKRNPMPESTNDRPTVAVEYVFQLTRQPNYYYGYEDLQRVASINTHRRLAQAVEQQIGSARANGGGKTNGNMKAVRGKKQDGHGRRHAGFNERYFDLPKSSAPASGVKNNDSMNEALSVMPEKRAFRNSDLFFDSLGAILADDGTIVALDVTTQPFKGAHFATFPPNLIEPLILAGCPAGGTVLDPFGGAGTTGLVADRLGRDAVLIELNPTYAAMASNRIKNDAGLLADVLSN